MTRETGMTCEYPPMGYAPPFPRPGWHPFWIAIMVLGFIVWWPIGLAILFYTMWSRKMGCWNRHEHWQGKMSRLQEKMDHMRSRMEGYSFAGMAPSGNRAFDEYRAETLRRLEDEQREFKEFLQRLRHAKDKAEFDQFMADRRARPQPPADQPNL